LLNKLLKHCGLNRERLDEIRVALQVAGGPDPDMRNIGICISGDHGEIRIPGKQHGG